MRLFEILTRLFGKRQTKFIADYLDAVFLPTNRKVSIFGLKTRWVFGMAFVVAPPSNLQFFYHGLSGLRMQVFVPKVVFEIVHEMVQIRFLIFESVICDVPQLPRRIAEMPYDNLLVFGKLSRYIQNQHTCDLHSDSINQLRPRCIPIPWKEWVLATGVLQYHCLDRDGRKKFKQAGKKKAGFSPATLSSIPLYPFPQSPLYLLL